MNSPIALWIRKVFNWTEDDLAYAIIMLAVFGCGTLIALLSYTR